MADAASREPARADAVEPRGSDRTPRQRVGEGVARKRLPAPWHGAVSLLDRLMAPWWNHWPLLLILVALAVWSGVWGFTDFYGPQYGRVPAYTWIFVPDSPLAVTAWIPAMLLVKSGLDKRADAGGAAAAYFANWAAVMNAKVGAWTMFVLPFYYEHFFGGGGAQAAFQWLLVASHGGMIVLGVLLFRKMRALTPSGYLSLLLLAFLWDFMDYVFVPVFLPGSGITIFPNGVPTDPDRIRTVAVVSVFLSLGSVGLLAKGMQWRGPPVER